MRVAVISDLHLGAGDECDAFGHDDAEFLGFLRFLEREFERIVLLGDIWETLTSPVLGRAREALAQARARHHEIAARFASERYVYVHGNHDLVAATEGAPDHHLLSADGVRLLFTHGHQRDTLVTNARWLSELGVWLGAWSRRMGAASVQRAFARMDVASAGSEDPSRCPYQRWAIAEGAERSADIVVTGHTHLATRAEHGSLLYLNSGTCSEGRTSFLALDTRRGSFEVCERW